MSWKQSFNINDKVKNDEHGGELRISSIVYTDHYIHGYVYKLEGSSGLYSDKYLRRYNKIKKIYLGGE